MTNMNNTRSHIDWAKPLEWVNRPSPNCTPPRVVKRYPDIDSTVLEWEDQNGESRVIVVEASNTCTNLRNVQPKPREVYVRQTPSGSIYGNIAYGRYEDALRAIGKNPTLKERVVKFVEVLE